MRYNRVDLSPWVNQLLNLRMKQRDWPKDSWQCPFCDYKANSLEDLVKHFRVKNRNGGINHPYKYIRARFRIEPIKRYNIKFSSYLETMALIGYDASKDPNNYQVKYSSFETNRRKH